MSAQLLQIRTSHARTAKNLLFAYGSNMNPKQLHKRCSHPVRISSAFLADHCLGFYGHSAEWDGALETAVKKRGHRLWGVVFDLSSLDWERLDLWQNARFDGTGRYFHYPVEVISMHGIHYEARMYKLDVLGPSMPPSSLYLEHLLEGARENQLPTSYIESLQMTHAAPAHYAVPLHADYDRAAAAGSTCTSCTDL